MADHAIFTGWGSVVRGREQRALDVFQETIQFWAQAQQDGRIESFEPVLVGPHGGDLAGFILARGERSQLDAIRSSDEFRRLVARAMTIVDDLGIVDAYLGDGLGRQLELFRQAADELG